MVRLTDIAHQILADQLQSGDIAVDATCGNGHDTLFLSQCVDREGRVIACDLQEQAIEATRQRCCDQYNVKYLIGDHAELLPALCEEYSSRVAAVMFNLGYLPGGDKAKTTFADTTTCALDASFNLLKNGGLLSVLAYVGHPAGEAEELAVKSRFENWSKAGTMQIVYHPQDDIAVHSPRLFVGSKL